MENALHHREGNDCAPVMVAGPLDILWENGFIVAVHAHGQIVPPHKRQRCICTVINNDLRFHQRAAWMHSDSNHAPHTVKRLCFSHPAGLGAIRVFHERCFGGHKSRRAVMLWPVKLHATGNPWAGKSNHSRLDAYVAVNEFVPVALQFCAMDFSTQFWQKFY